MYDSNIKSYWLTETLNCTVEIQVDMKSCHEFLIYWSKYMCFYCNKISQKERYFIILHFVCSLWGLSGAQFSMIDWEKVQILRSFYWDGKVWADVDKCIFIISYEFRCIIRDSLFSIHLENWLIFQIGKELHEKKIHFQLSFLVAKSTQDIARIIQSVSQFKTTKKNLLQQ